MQVVSSATGVVREAYSNPTLDRKLAAADALPKTQGAAISYIVSSTRLSAAEKSSFIRMLGDVQGADADLIASIMATVQLTESTRSEGTYPATAVEQAIEQRTNRPAFKVRAELAALVAAGLDILA